MVKQIITAHDGDITFTTEEGKGTVFVVELPFL
jgi:signal transduction histidine kinase